MQNLSLVSFATDPLPTYQDAIVDLGPLVNAAYEALEVGANICRSFYDEHCAGESPEPHLREMLVRSRARRHLLTQGIEARAIKEPGFQLASEPLLSLLIHREDYAIRVLKAKSGLVPGCGTSKRRRAFYNQAPVRYLGLDGKVYQSKSNVLLLWDFDNAFGISSVWLACPQRAGSRSQDVVLAWQELVPHIATQQPSSSPEVSVRNKAAEDELEELLTGRSSKETTIHERTATRD
jgi:hypothetical protein